MAHGSDRSINEWFVRIEGEIRGPMTMPQVRQLIQNGEIDESTEVRPVTKQNWRPAGRVKSLFPEAGASRKKRGEASRKKKPRTLEEIRAAENRQNVMLLAILAVGAPFGFGLLFASLDLQLTFWERVGTFFGSSVLLLLFTVPTFIYQCFPQYRETVMNVGKRVAGGIGGVVVLILIILVIRNSGRFLPAIAPAYDEVDLGDRLPGEWVRYDDPKRRFHCQVPPGWNARHAEQGDKSKLILSSDGHEIRITVRHTNHHVLNEADRREMVAGMGKVAGKMGSGGRVVEDEWTTVGESRALRIDMESTTPPRFVRMMKIKRNRWDHVVALYVTPDGSSRKAMLQVFDEFLKRYDRDDKPAPQQKKTG